MLYRSSRRSDWLKIKCVESQGFSSSATSHRPRHRASLVVRYWPASTTMGSSMPGAWGRGSAKHSPPNQKL